MRITVFILSLIGGIIALVGTLIGMAGAGAAAGLGAEGMEGIGGQIFLGFVLAILTIIAGSLVLAHKSPKVWGIVLITASVIGSIVAGGFYLFGGIIALIAGILALFVKPAKAAIDGGDPARV